MTSISIIIPVYRVEGYIRECLASVVNQHEAKAQIECIVVDDCSPDNSMAIARDFVSHYQGDVRFQLLKHDVNRGLSAARNTGIAASTGDYLLFLDSDDYLLPDGIATLMAGFDLCPGADVIQGNLMDGRNQDKPYYQATRPLVFNDRNQALKAMANGKMPVCACNRLVKKSVIVSHQLYFIEGILHEDNPWSYQLMGVVSRVVVLPQCTYYYRYVASSITHSQRQNFCKVIDSWNVILDTILGTEKNSRGAILLYVFSQMLGIKDMMSQQKCTAEERKAMDEMQRKLQKKAIHYKRPLLLIWFLTIYKPFYYIYSFAIVRRKYAGVEKRIFKIETKIDSLNW